MAFLKANNPSSSGDEIDRWMALQENDEMKATEYVICKNIHRYCVFLVQFLKSSELLT